MADFNSSMKSLKIELTKYFEEMIARMVASGRYDGQTLTGAFFLPLDYERAVRLLNATCRSLSKQGGE